VARDFDEYDLDLGHGRRISTILDWMGTVGTTVGVVFRSGHRYELDDVPDATWRAFVAQRDRAFDWWSSDQHADEKQTEVSIGAFYKQTIEPNYPRWMVDDDGLCTPHNELAREWEAQHGRRGTTRLHMYVKDGRWGRHGHS
jgi:hypothetical protein